MPPFGGPPGWYPPPGQGFPGQPPNFPPYGYPPGPPGQQFPPGQGQQSKPAPIGPGANKQTTPNSSAPQNDKQAEPKSIAKPAEMAAAAVKAPTPPVASKPSPSAVQAAVSQAATPSTSTATAPAAKLAPKNNGRIQPAVPLKSPAPASAPLANVANSAGPIDSTLQDATAAATAAVAAAMAKLPPAGGQANGNAVDNLTRKVNEMRTNDPVRAPRHPTVAGGFNGRARGNRGGARGGATPKVEVPTTDFDFEESNAKFNKHDLVKEAIAGSPLGEPSFEDSPEPEVPVGGYNKSTSFFDNISSESKDRAESGSNKPGGREWRGEEQKKNVETFGQGSVDNGYRGGYRGRGRGRGYRGRGYSNGQPGRGRGSYRGTRGDAQTSVQ
jgi:protein LSM14